MPSIHFLCKVPVAKMCEVQPNVHGEETVELVDRHVEVPKVCESSNLTKLVVQKGSVTSPNHARQGGCSEEDRTLWRLAPCHQYGRLEVAGPIEPQGDHHRRF